MSEAKITGWHHQHSGHELGQTLGDGEGQGGLAQSLGLQRVGTTGRLNNNKNTLNIVK